MRHVFQSIDFLQEELDLQLPAVADEIVEEVDDEEFNGEESTLLTQVARGPRQLDQNDAGRRGTLQIFAHDLSRVLFRAFASDRRRL